MAGLARHLVVAVGAFGRRYFEPPALREIVVFALGNELGARGLGVVLRMLRVDRVLDQRHLPFLVGEHHGALE